jgi:hypothetical protein
MTCNNLVSLLLETWEWNYVGEAGETITARNSHSLHVITVTSSPSPSSSLQADKETAATLDSVVNYLVLFGGSSPELGPLGDTYYAELPAGGITSEWGNLLCCDDVDMLMCCIVVCCDDVLMYCYVVLQCDIL